MTTVTLFLTVPLRRSFKAELRIPEDITKKEADQLSAVIQEQVGDPSGDLKFMAADPAIGSGVTE